MPSPSSIDGAIVEAIAAQGGSEHCTVCIFVRALQIYVRALRIFVRAFRIFVRSLRIFRTKSSLGVR